MWPDFIVTVSRVLCYQKQALPHGEFGLDFIALIGTLRHEMHHSVPEIHEELCKQGVVIVVPLGKKLHSLEKHLPSHSRSATTTGGLIP